MCAAQSIDLDRQTYFAWFEHDPTKRCDVAERFAASAAVTVSMLVLTRRSWTLTAAVSEEAPVDCCERSTVAVEPSEASTALIRVSMVPVMRVTVAASVVDCTAAVEAAAASIAVIEAVSVAACSAAAVAVAACMAFNCVVTAPWTLASVASVASSRI